MERRVEGEGSASACPRGRVALRFSPLLMALNLFNTLTRRIEPFAPMDAQGRRVGMYCCGPTVHDFAHIGNFRTFVLADLLRRYLEFRATP
jgi:hypothetical protein